MGKPPKKRTLPKAAEPYKFKPGVSGNPKGRIPNPIPKALRELTIDSYRNVIEAVCTGNMDHVKSMLTDPKVSALQAGVASAVLTAIRNGDYSVIERIAERIVGKIPEVLRVDSTSQNMNLNLNAGVSEDKLRLALAKFREEI